MNRRDRNHCGLGFTLVEVLVVISIISLLISMLMPSFKSARENAKMLKCQNFMRQTAIANTSYSSDNLGMYVYTSYGGATYNGVNYTRYWATDPAFVPYVGLRTESVSNKWRTNDGSYGAGFSAGVQWPDEFDCPNQGKPKYWLQNDYWGHEIGISYNKELGNTSAIRNGDVRGDAKKFQFADGDNWWMNSKFSDYKLYSDTGAINHGGWGGLLPRHIGETANVAFFDCHAERLRKDETYFYGPGAAQLIKERWNPLY